MLFQVVCAANNNKFDRETDCWVVLDDLSLAKNQYGNLFFIIYYFIFFLLLFTCIGSGLFAIFDFQLFFSVFQLFFLKKLKNFSVKKLKKLKKLKKFFSFFFPKIFDSRSNNGPISQYFCKIISCIF